MDAFSGIIDAGSILRGHFGVDIFGSNENIIDGVLEEFIELSAMPHGSGNEWQISNYLMCRLEELGLHPQQDDYWNVICDVPATSGYENAPLTILQGHMDMVCVKAEDSAYSPSTDGILVLVMDGKLRSNGASSLGADCGIGNAAVLYLIGKHTIHGPLRLIFTVDEERGLVGASKLDPRHLDGARYLINTDGFRLRDVVVSSSGGRRETYTKRLATTSPKGGGRCFHIRIDGFKGGHSGYDINKDRANAIKVMGRFLDDLMREIPFSVSALNGGAAHNAIPSSCNATIVIREDHVDTLRDACRQLQERIKSVYDRTDDGGYITLTERRLPQQVWSRDCLESTLNLILLIFNGVYSMNNYIPDRVSSSSNLGRVYVNDTGQIEICSYIRCAVDANEEDISLQHTKAATLTGFSCQVNGYKGWPGNTDNALARLMDRIYRRYSGQALNITATHAGLEPSIFYHSHPHLTMVNVGMNIENPHSLDEHVHIDSIPPFVRLLRATLHSIAEIEDIKAFIMKRGI